MCNTCRRRSPDRANRNSERRIGGYNFDARKKREREIWFTALVPFRKQKFINKIAQPGYEPTKFDISVIDQIKQHETSKRIMQQKLDE